MIEYRKSNLRIAELYFDETARPVEADIVRHRSRTSEVEGAVSAPVYTILLDLLPEPERILRQMNSTKRNLIQRASKDGLAVEIDSHPSDATLREFYTFYDVFAAGKRLPAANRERMNGVRDGNSLTLSCVRDGAGGALVWHCYIRASNWVRLHYSASHFREATDKERLALLSRANCYLHWRDILQFRERGCATYDLGGWYDGQDDKEKLGVNLFKQGFGGAVTKLFNADEGRTLLGSFALRARRALGRMKGEV